MKYCDIEHRDNLGSWLNEHGLIGSGAEIGCAFGGYARTVLSKWNGQVYFMVDPFIEQPKDVYKERTTGIDFNQYYRDCQKLAEEDHRVRLIRKYSVEGAKDIEDGSLDWVFIDGNHSARAVLEDMDAWYPKVKSGGLFSGDDYGLDVNFPNFCEVKTAVDRWMAEREIVFTICRRPAWWAIKP